MQLRRKAELTLSVAYKRKCYILEIYNVLRPAI